VAFVILGLSACDDSSTSPVLPGSIYEGEWVGQAHGSPMSLSIGQFEGLGGSEGRIRWESHNWRLSCSSFSGESLSCDVIPDAAGCVPVGRVLPYVEVLRADSLSIEAVVGGELHEPAEPCVVDPIVMWEPEESVTFLRR